MKFIHTSDLHIGRRLGEYSLLDDQRDMLQQLLALIREERPDALLIAGDIYDKTVPSAEAVGLLDDFLTEAADMTCVLMISGNHDSPERIAFGGRLMRQAGLHVCGMYGGDSAAQYVTLTDAWGEVRFYLLPFLRSADVRRSVSDPETERAEMTFDAAFSAVLDAMKPDAAVRSVLLAHQFVTGSERCESEMISVGTADAVAAEHFARFDYAALGHLHRAQICGGQTSVRYSGSPLAYSIAEADDQKSVLLVTLGQKGDCSVESRPITPYRRMYRLRGTYEMLMSQAYYRDTDYPDAYVQITLTDEQDIPDALYRLRTVYPYLLRLEYDNTRTRTEQPLDVLTDADAMDPAVLFAAFYRAQNGDEMDVEMKDYMDSLIGPLWKGGHAQ